MAKDDGEKRKKQRTLAFLASTLHASGIPFPWDKHKTQCIFCLQHSLTLDSKPVVHRLEGLWTTAAVTATTVKPLARCDAWRRKTFPANQRSFSPETQSMVLFLQPLPQTFPDLHTLIKAHLALFAVAPADPDTQRAALPQSLHPY